MKHHAAVALVVAILGVHPSGAQVPSPVTRAAAPSIDVEIVLPRARAAHRPVFSEDELRRRLRPLAGAQCVPGVLEDALARPYRFLGYVPSITVACGTDGGIRARVRESSALIEIITFEPADLARVGVKPDPDFEDRLRLYPVPADAPRAVLLGLLLTREGDLYNFERYRSDREALGKLGYTVAFIPGTAEGKDDYPRGAYLVQSTTPRAPGRGGARKTNYLGGTASYGPRAKGAAGLLYEKDQLFGEFDRLSVSPTFNFGAGGTLSYDAPFLARRALPRRLYDISVSVYSTFTNDRLLGILTTDERQTGFSGTLGIRPLLMKPPHSLRFEAGFRSERVGLDRVPPGEEEGATDSVEIGATYEWRHTYRRPSLTARLAPRADFALRARGGERAFVRTGIDAMLHARFPSAIETDLHAVLGTIDRAVPSFELWSLGGAGSVRGFKEDSLLGRRLAVLQMELWFPFVRTGSAAAQPGGAQTPDEAPAARFEPRAARLLKWALFADGGALSDTTEGRSASIAGTGAGLRFLVPHHPFVVKIDYARGWGARGGHAYPYVSLVYRY